ncbi:hypothetical protein [Candidatus Stoquefichus massiliensis]|uniref:hypothetical protein n=1 Tax=Candidatus Stoquefichus massiliensis TaxID=1470350 RepID=UPI0004B46592|nr:hypothetical protein [Candidatus Stoquefichus massiliensis]
MGVWSAAIFGSDTACDLKDNFFKRYNQGEEPQSIKNDILKQFGEEEKCDVIFALADCMWQVGELDNQFLDEVTSLVLNGEDIAHAKSLDADEQFLKQREKITKKFIKKISVKKAKSTKRVSPPVPVKSKYINGTVLAFQYSDQTWGALIVIGGKHFDKETYYTYIQTSLRIKNIPSMEDIYSSYIIDRSFHNMNYIAERSPSLYYTFTNCILGYLKATGTKRFEKYNDQFFEIVGRLSDWGDCSSGIFSRLGYDKYKTYEEFQIESIKELTERYQDNPEAYTSMNIKEIEEEMTSQDINVIIEKYNICQKYDKIIHFIKQLPSYQQIPQILRQLAAAYNNKGNKESLLKAINILVPLKDQLSDYEYCYTLGYSYFFLPDYIQAQALLEKALSCCEIDEKTRQIKEMLKEIENNKGE